MGGRRIDRVLIFGFVLVGTGVILQIISVATTHWMHFAHYVHHGLFKLCGERSCINHPYLEELKVTQALTLSGLVMAVLVCPLLIVVTIKGYRCQLQTSMPGGIAGILALLSGLVTFSGAMVFLDKVYGLYNRYYNMELDYSFVLSIVGAIVTGMGGIFALIGTNRLVAFANRTPGEVLTSRPSNLAVVYSVGNAPGSQPNQSLRIQPYAGTMYATPPLNSGPAMSPQPAPGNPQQQYGYAGYAEFPPPYSEVAEGKNGS